VDTKVTRKVRNIDQIQERDDQDRSRLVHHVGPVGTGLFPGWGPKL